MRVIGMLRQLLLASMHGIASQTERKPCVESSTTLGLGVDCERSLHEFQPFLYAIETKPSCLSCGFEIKTHATIIDGEMNLMRRSLELDVELPHAAMLHRVVQGFL